MAGWIEEDPEGGARLVFVQGGAQLQYRRLCGVQVADRDVEVHLLRLRLRGPARRLVVNNLLEADHLTVVGPHLCPVGLDSDRPVEDRAVERGEPARVGAVDDNARECSYSYVPTLVSQLRVVHELAELLRAAAGCRDLPRPFAGVLAGRQVVVLGARSTHPSQLRAPVRSAIGPPNNATMGVASSLAGASWHRWHAECRFRVGNRCGVQVWRCAGRRYDFDRGLSRVWTTAESEAETTGEIEAAFVGV